MMDVALLLAVAALAFAVRRVTHIPLIPLLLLAGIGLSLSDLALDRDTARHALDLGLAVLVFSAGMELNPKRFGAHKHWVLGVGFGQFFLIGLGGVLVTRGFGYSWQIALYLGLAISTSSTLIIVRLLKSRQQMFEPFGRVVTGTLLLQDLLIILMIVALIRLPDGVWGVVQGLGGLSILLLMCVVGLRYVMPFMVLRMKLDQEALGLAILMVLFVFMSVAHLLNLPLITGAFLAGVSLSAFPINSVARGLISSITSFFMALFFIVLGGLIQFPSATEWLLAGALTALILVGTPIIVTLVALRMGMNTRSAIESGLLLAMTSEFSLLVGLQGYLIGQLPSEIFNVVAVVTVVTMTVTPLLATDRLTWWLMRIVPGSAPQAAGDLAALSGHVVMLGYGKGSSVVFKALKQAGYDVVIVNDDAAVVRDLVAQGTSAVYGDGSDPRVLDLVQARRAKIIIASMRRVSDAESVLRLLGREHPPLIIRVFDPDEAARIEACGGIPVISSEAAAEAFMKWHEQVIQPHSK